MSKTTRRDFMKTAGAAAVSMTAASYARVAGANERISIGMIGCGDRGLGALMPGVRRYDKEQNVEFTAVCDAWRQNREKGAAMIKDWYGRDAHQFVSYQDLLARDDIDAVMIASCDHQHTAHLEGAARAKKDAYCEKPLAMDFDKLKAAIDACRENNIVVQAGTQLRSYPSFTGCREVYQSGILGKVGRIEQLRNSSTPYWYSRVKPAKEEDVDWAGFLMDRPMRPFNSVHFTGWYGYRDFSDGPVPGLASHFIDLVHYITGATFPTSVVSLGGTFTWKDDYQFTCPDHVQAEWIYPEGFMVSYATNFGNGSGNTFKIFGDEGVIDMVEWNSPVLTSEGARQKTGKVPDREPIAPVERPDHALDWLQCLRSRKSPNAGIDAAYQHAVAVIMAVRAYDTGRRQIYDQATREIREG